MTFVEALFTYLLAGEINMVKLFVFLSERHKENHTRSLHKG